MPPVRAGFSKNQHAVAFLPQAVLPGVIMTDMTTPRDRDLSDFLTNAGFEQICRQRLGRLGKSFFE